MSLPRYPRPALLEQLPPAGHAVIEASAGTGKTFAIEHILVELVLQGTPIEQVLVVTFSEKAAADLRRRIRALLARILACAPGQAGAEPAGAAWTIGPRERALLVRASFDFHLAPISTIHAFCQGVLSEHAFATGRLLQETLVDPVAAFHAAFLGALRSELAPRGRPLRPELLAWLDQSGPGGLETLLLDVHRLRAEGIRPPLQSAPLRELLGRLRAELDGGALTRGIAALERVRTLRNTVEAVRARFAALEQLQPLLGEALLAAHLAAFERFALPYLLGEPQRLRRLRNAGGRTLAPLLELLEEIAGRLTTRQAAAAQLFLPPVQAGLRRRKALRGEYDFDDMLSALREALEGPGAALLLATLRARYRYGLIDEFQDTDQVQWRIFERLFLDARAGAAPGRLYVIADPKQAIYGFRGADVFAYLRAREALLAGAPAVTLEESYRATPALVEAHNILFDQGAEPPHFDGAPIAHRPLRCGHPEQVALGPDGAALAAVHLFHLQDPSGELDARRARWLLGRRIAREARDLVGGGLRVGARGAQGPLRGLGWGDLFVLARTGWELVEVSRHLRAAGVPCAFYKQDGLFRTPEARDLRLVLAAVADPSRRERRVRAWLTPFFGLSLSDLTACGDPPPDSPLVRRLLAWSALARRRAWERLFAALVEESGFLRRELALGEGERALTNTLHILEVLLERALASGCELEELVRLLAAWYAGTRAPEGLDQDVQRLESDAQAVQLMTMHKSKGLEAEVVFLFGGISDPRRRDVHPFHEPEEEATDGGPAVYHDPRTLERVVHVGPMDRATSRRVQEEREQEERRLLYVACTRARSRLYLPSFDRHRDARGEWEWDLPRLAGCFVFMAERLRQVAHGEACGPLPNRWFQVERLAPEAPPRWDEAALDAACAAWRAPPALLADRAPEPAPLAAAHAPVEVLSYSRLRRRQEQAFGFEESEEEPEGAGLPADASPDPLALPGGPRAGSCLHQLLEELPRESFAGWPARAVWLARPEVQALGLRALRRWGFEARHLPWVLGVAHDALRTPLALPGGVALAHGLAGADAWLPELEFLYPVPAAETPPLALAPGARVAVGPGYVRGFMDLVFQAGGRTWVLDWKGSLRGDYAPAALRADVDAHYRTQAELYTLAVVRLLELPDPAAYEARFGGVLYAYVRGMRPEAPGSGVLAERPAWSDVLRFEARLRAAARGGAPGEGSP